jgi:hypothetical protein
MSQAFRAVLFDWRGTLFHDEDEADFIRASAASIGRTLTSAEVNSLVESLPAAAEHPEVIAAHGTADCSPDLHRAAVLLELGLARFDHDLALACHDRDGNPNASMPYPDTAEVLQRLKACGSGSSATFIIAWRRISSITAWGSSSTATRYTSSTEYKSRIRGPQPGAQACREPLATWYSARPNASFRHAAGAVTARMERSLERARTSVCADVRSHAAAVAVGRRPTRSR